MLERSYVGVVLLATMACGGGGGGGSLQQAPTDRTVTMRFIGPDGDPFFPQSVVIGNKPVPPETFQSWRMQAWADGVHTDRGDIALIPGVQYQLLIGSFKPGVFGATTITFTAPEGPLDFGTIDLATQSFSMTTPAEGSTAASYPVQFAWTPYPNPDAEYKVMISNEGSPASVGPFYPSAATSYLLTAEVAAPLDQRAARWRVEVTFTAPEGYSVRHISDLVRFTLPE